MPKRSDKNARILRAAERLYLAFDVLCAEYIVAIGDRHWTKTALWADHEGGRALKTIMREVGGGKA